MAGSTQPVTIAAINAGVSDPSSTRLLADRIAQKTIDALRESGTPATIRTTDLGPLGADIARALVSGIPNPAVRAVIEQVAQADAVTAATPVEDPA